MNYISLVTVTKMKSLTLVLCMACVASHLVFSMPVEQESAIQEQVPLDQQVGLSIVVYGYGCQTFVFCTDTLYFKSSVHIFHF